MPKKSKTVENSGGSSDYYVVDILDPIHIKTPYTTECLDIIETLEMDYHESNAFKAIWRKCAARTLGKEKKGNNALRDAEKVHWRVV